VPHDAYRCQGADRWAAVACFDDLQRAALADVLGAAPDWADPEVVDAAVGAWTAARTREECVAALRSAGVPAVPVLDARDRAAEAHFGRRRVFIDGPTGRRTRGFPFVLRNYVPPVPARAPAVGEHNKRFAAQPHPR
jgi:crotonobetainyl-CoA:carnitine CoA-transferase CaiB-like acyl-CoA transferase